MALYLGFFSADPSYAAENGRRQREGGPFFEPTLARMVAELPEKLPPTCRYVSAYSAGGMRIDGVPLASVVVVEAADTSDLQFIERYYAGYLQVRWAPTSSIGATREERERALASEPGGART